MKQKRVEILIEKNIIEIDFGEFKALSKEELKENFLRNRKTGLEVIGISLNKEEKWEKDIFAIGDAVLYELFGIPLMVLKGDIGLDILKDTIKMFNVHLDDKGKGIIVIMPDFNSILKPEVYFKVLDKVNGNIFAFKSEIKREIPYSLKDVV
jgi:hypothetical protein